MIKIKNVYDKPDIHDGVRILVERRWPRGMRRSSSHVDMWLKRIGPSPELHKWFIHNQDKWVEYEKRYRHEMVASKPFNKLIDVVLNTDVVTLLFTRSNHEENDAVVVWRALQERLEKMKKYTSQQ